MSGPVTFPFGTAEEAWFWTMARLVARQEGSKPPEGPSRPCTADDVVLVLDRLYRRRSISLEQVRLIRLWGAGGDIPGNGLPHEHQLWNEAMAALDAPLRAKGIVGEAPRD